MLPLYIFLGLPGHLGLVFRYEILQRWHPFLCFLKELAEDNFSLLFVTIRVI